ncbi:MAG TPA: gluconate 2-dehydrogenase subunit 3 family protein [Thermomicrobiales bacterium]|nr:gluconate 2-dehydrogenase subunit 3 family protein [Thermomicrobiales bacterium]
MSHEEHAVPIPITNESTDQDERPDETQPRGRMSRRRFLATGATTGAAAGMLAVAPAVAKDATSAGQSMANMPGMDQGTPTAGAQPALDGFVHFPPPDAAIIAAAAARLIPTDENGPGATEAGVVYFIDRQLDKEDKGYTGPIYFQGPFMEGTPTQGDQSGLSIPDRFRIGIAGMDDYAQQVYQKGFASLSADQQDRILSDMEQGIPKTFDGTSIQSFPPIHQPGGTEAGMETAGIPSVGAKAFFNLLWEYTVAGFFADPVHGGNRDMVGWKLIGFPGAQGFVYSNWILRYGEEFTGEYKSLASYQHQFGGGS